MNLPTDAPRGERWRQATVWSLVVFAGTLPVSHVPAQLAVAIACIMWIGWSVAARRPQVVGDAFFVAAGTYWIWNILSALLSARPVHTLGAFVDNEWPALAGILLLWSVRSTSELRRILLALFGTSGLAMVYGIVQSFTGTEWVSGSALHMASGGLFRAVGFSGFYLTFAGFAMTVFFLSAAYALESPQRRSRWIVPVLCLGAILGTFARSVWLAMSILVPVMAVVAGRREWRTWVWASGLVVIFVVLAVEPLRERAVSIVDLTQHETRLNLWKTSIRIFADHPIFGIGQDNFTLVFETYRVEGFYDTFVHPHNDYLSVLVHGGLPALAGFLGMWVIVLKRGWKTWRQGGGNSLSGWLGLGGMLALAGFLASSMFQNYYGTFVNCFNWWLITGLILTSYRLGGAAVQSRS